MITPLVTPMCCRQYSRKRSETLSKNVCWSLYDASHVHNLLSINTITHKMNSARKVKQSISFMQQEDGWRNTETAVLWVLWLHGQLIGVSQPHRRGSRARLRGEWTLDPSVCKDVETSPVSKPPSRRREEVRAGCALNLSLLTGWKDAVTVLQTLPIPRGALEYRSRMNSVMYEVIKAVTPSVWQIPTFRRKILPPSSG
jgi:hypothetical protein